MIFVTVGHELGFDRLIQAMNNWALENPNEEILAQVGDLSKGYFEPKNIPFREFLSPSEFTEVFEKSDLIVAHAGMGTIITALMKQKPIVIFPRYGKFKETRNDHQVATAERFKSRPGILVANDEDELSAAISKFSQPENLQRPLQKAGEFADANFISGIRDFILKG